MKRILLYAAILEIIYLAFSFLLAQNYGQWSYEGEIIRTGLRLISIVFYCHIYRKYFYIPSQIVRVQKVLSLPFVVALALFIFFALAYTNAENETIEWQFVFFISGIFAGIREELFYRGIIQRSLQKKFAYKLSLLFSNILFTLSHIQYIYYGQPQGLILIACAGMIFGSIFIYTNSLVFSAAIHGLYDSMLSINVSSFRLSNIVALPILFSITMLFLIILKQQQTENAHS